MKSKYPETPGEVVAIYNPATGVNKERIKAEWLC